MKLNCYIVDDEQHALELLHNYIERNPGLMLVGETTNPLKALCEITSLKPDLTFVDVDMPEISGLELAQKIKAYTTIVFTTSFREYAVEAFDQQSLDYLLKPFSYDRFLKTIEKFNVHSKPEDAYFFVKGGAKGNLIKIPIAEVIHINGMLNYVEIFQTQKKVISHLSLEEILDKLPDTGFTRIHKSHIVSHQYLISVNYAFVKLSNQDILPIGRVYRKNFMQKIDSGLKRYDK